MELTLGNVIALAATTGVLTALLNQALSMFREWWLSSRNTKARAGYHALRLAVILEAYAEASTDFINDNYNAETPHDSEYPAWKLKLPELPPYPDDPEGWRAIDLKLAARALNLRNRIGGSQGIIWSTREYTEDELGDTLDEQAAERGLEAWEIAVALRRKHGLGEVDLIWNFVDRMQETRQRALESKREANERHAKMAAIITDTGG